MLVTKLGLNRRIYRYIYIFSYIDTYIHTTPIQHVFCYVIVFTVNNDEPK